MVKARWPLRPPIELRSIDPAKNRFRRYRLMEQGTLFATPDLVVEWGRIGRSPRIRREHFSSAQAMLARRLELLGRRKRHGYVELPASRREEETSTPPWPTKTMCQEITLPARP